jgi:hypothetical protein
MASSRRSGGTFSVAVTMTRGLASSLPQQLVVELFHEPDEEEAHADDARRLLRRRVLLHPYQYGEA